MRPLGNSRAFLWSIEYAIKDVREIAAKVASESLPAPSTLDPALIHVTIFSHHKDGGAAKMLSDIVEGEMMLGACGVDDYLHAL